MDQGGHRPGQLAEVMQDEQFYLFLSTPKCPWNGRRVLATVLADIDPLVRNLGRC